MWVCTGGFLYVAGFVFMIAIIVGVFVQSNVYYLVISCVGALLFSAYLLFDLQLIMGGALPLSWVPKHGKGAATDSMSLPAECNLA